jgi:FMN phosphatase YigB (HAD superfamily)
MRLISFDVFDTALTRPWVQPTDLFYALALEAQHSGIWAGGLEEFRAARITAEIEARRRAPGDEVTLADIYAVLAQALGWTAEDRRLGEQIEQTVELESCIPIDQVVQRVKAALVGDTRLLFISDTYLDTETIEKMLRRCGIPTGSARLFVSSAYGKTKATGDLFLATLAEFGAAPEELSHLGDHPVSDLGNARRIGIRANQFEGGARNHYETAVIDGRYGSAMLASAIAGSSRGTRLERHFDDAHRRTIWATCANVSGPLLSGYVLWLLGRAVALGRRRLYFFARDGQILKKLADTFVSWYGLEIEIRYFYASRQAFFLPALTEVDADALRWFGEEGEGKTLKDILARVDLSFEQVAAQMAEAPRPLLPSTRLTREDLEFVLRVLADRTVEPAILAAASRRRALLLEYLDQEGMLDGTPFAIVDIGWRGRLQRALHSVLVGSGRLEHEELVGFYLGMFSPVAQMPWGVIEVCLPQGVDYNASLIEFFTSADHGSTIGYERIGSRIEPILGAMTNDGRLKADIVLQQEGVTAFAANLLRALRLPVTDPALLGDALREVGAAAFDRMVHRPSADEAEIFGSVQQSRDQAHLVSHDIAPRVGFGVVCLAAIGQLGPLRRVGDWPIGSLRRSVRIKAAGAILLHLLELRRRSVTSAKRYFRNLSPRRKRMGMQNPV